MNNIIDSVNIQNSETINNTRRNMIKTSALAAVGGIVGSTMLNHAHAQTLENATGNFTGTSAMPKESSFWLSNVTLETGFERNQDKQVLATITKVTNLLIENGKIIKISDEKPNDGLSIYDMHKHLALPSFADMHIHLDKGRYGGPWKATTSFKTVAQRIKEEEEILISLLPDTPRKVKALLDLMTGNGTTHLRVQCNVDPVQGLQNKEKVLEGLMAYEDKLSYELVAFPQHGFIKNLKLMDQAMASGFDIIGGVDPATIDGDIERTLNATVELAVKYNKGIDIHLHEGGSLGAFTIERLAKLADEAKLHGRVAVSHAFCLGDIPEKRLDDLLSLMAQVKMQVMSSAPIRGTIPPVTTLTKKGVPMYLGIDSVNDIWSAYGNGNMIERVSRLGEINRWNDEYNLNRALKHITRGIMPLSDEGVQVWPKVGDVANISFIKASCSAEMIARQNPVSAVFYKGKPSVWKI